MVFGRKGEKLRKNDYLPFQRIYSNSLNCTFSTEYSRTYEPRSVPCSARKYVASPGGYKNITSYPIKG